MKIDIKSIVNALAAGDSEKKTTNSGMDIRQVLADVAEEGDAEAEASEDVGEEQVAPEAEEVEASEAVQESEEAEVSEDVGEEQVAPEAEKAEASETVQESEEAEASEDVSEEQVAPEAEKAEASEAVQPSEEEVRREPEGTDEEQVAPEADGSSSADDEESSAEEPTADDEESSAEEEEPSEDEEKPSDAEQATEETKRDPAPFQTKKEKLLAWGRSYGWITGIAASFLILMAFMVIYTTMTPREIHAIINGEAITFTTEERTVAEFLVEENISFCEEDYLSVPLDAFIHDGVSFELAHAKDFTVTADGETKDYKSLDNTVQQALDDVGIKVGERDIVKPKPDTPLAQGMSVIVKRVVIKREVVEKIIPFRTIQKDDTTMMEGRSKVVKQGRDGKAEVTYEVKYVDGKEASRKKVDRKVITKARNKVVANGTMVNYNGKKYSRKLVVKAYAYTGGGTTAMGTRARVGEIAVDPSVIPLGTNVYIEGVGPRRAEDTGGNIKGNTIDIYMDTQQECINWGVRYVTIYIE